MYSERDRIRLFFSSCFASVLISPPRVYFPCRLLNIPSPHVLDGYLGVLSTVDVPFPRVCVRACVCTYVLMYATSYELLVYYHKAALDPPISRL